MSPPTVAHTQTQQPGKRSNRGRGGRRGSKASQSRQDKPVATPNTTVDESTPSNSAEVTKDTHEASQTEVSDAAVCFICAEPVKYYSVSACNHRTCHVCALRLRALYKRLDCTFCKEQQVTVIFTSSPNALFSSYTPNDIPHKDSKLSIHFETVDMMEETLVLLRYNCPDRDCDYTGTGWGDLKIHVRATHDKMLCDLCLRFKKVFAHEHTLYPPNILPFHLPSKLHRSHKQQQPKEPVEGGIHPLCEFCRECFFSDDELYVHMRERHEECFICKRNEIRDQYFHNYECLEQHFTQAHFACPSPMCQAQKFVVFGSALDLKAHQVEVHDAEMSSRDRRDIRRVQAEFAFEDIRGERGNRATRERDREPPPESNQSSPRALGGRRGAFGGRLTGGSAAESTGGVPFLLNAPGLFVPGPSTAPEDAASEVSERYASFLSRVQAAAPNPAGAIPALKAAIRGYRVNESSARDLISTVWNILGNDLDGTASIVNGIVDLLDEESKKSDLLASWNGFKIEQRQHFPELVPTSVGTAYAGVASGRVISAKKATSRSSRQTSRQVWDRVAQAASSSAPRMNSPLPSRAVAERFPALPRPSPASVAPQPQPQRASASASVATYHSLPVSPSTTPGASAGRRKPPPSFSLGAFPELPSSTNTRPRPPLAGNPSLRNIIGDPLPSGSAWGAAAPDSTPNNNGNSVTETTPRSTFGLGKEGEGGKGKKGKGKQRQTLFTFGSFPT
ncbi:hypothetical protein BKA82DRAFT_4250547 [Pisolithus tinctorius]|nr:hypothetical protein BKA82DRAFT_4250547 [Pisolithus tinctorius]